MKTKTLNSTEQLKGFAETFSIYTLLKNSRKTIHTIQNPSVNQHLPPNINFTK
jgi:hypothetical protein